MGQYDELVERQQLLLEAEVWAEKIKNIHTFDSDTTTMGYDYPNTTREGYVTDTTFNDGRVERLVHKTQKKYLICEKLTSKELLKTYQRGT